ncbi:hypothetical protein EON79_03965 [bacterium]|nr:MAG: hypothetical protein EON79_03965 [bacterium]
MKCNTKVGDDEKFCAECAFEEGVPHPKTAPKKPDKPVEPWATEDLFKPGTLPPDLQRGLDVDRALTPRSTRTPGIVIAVVIGLTVLGLRVVRINRDFQRAEENRRAPSEAGRVAAPVQPLEPVEKPPGRSLTDPTPPVIPNQTPPEEGQLQQPPTAFSQAEMADMKMQTLADEFQTNLTNIEAQYQTTNGVGVDGFVTELGRIADEMESTVPLTSPGFRANAEQIAQIARQRTQQEVVRMSGNGPPG